MAGRAYGEVSWVHNARGAGEGSAEPRPYEEDVHGAAGVCGGGRTSPPAPAPDRQRRATVSSLRRSTLLSPPSLPRQTGIRCSNSPLSAMIPQRQCHATPTTTSPGVAVFQVGDRCGDFGERTAPVNLRAHLAGLNQLRKPFQILGGSVADTMATTLPPSRESPSARDAGESDDGGFAAFGKGTSEIAHRPVPDRVDNEVVALPVTDEVRPR